MKQNSISTHQQERFYTRAKVDASSIINTETEKSFEVIFATENPVPRRGWEENFEEVLSCDPANIRTGRLEESAVPLLLDHTTKTGQLGIVTAYSIQDNQCRAKILFSTRSEFTGIWSDICAKVIRSISAGYNVYKYLREVMPNSQIPTYRAVDWEPMEISLTPIPADYRSTIRTELSQTDIIIENLMKPSEQQADTTNQENTRSPLVQPPVDATAIRNEGVQAERTRIIQIRNAAKLANLGSDFSDDLIARGLTIEDARKEILDKIAESATTHNIRNTVNSVIVSVNETEKTKLAMCDALLHRSNPGSVQLEDQAHDYKYMSLLDMARHYLKQNGENAARYSASETIKRAISTTDYPDLLNSTVERSIRRTYNAIPAEWKEIAQQTSAKDFREKTGIAVDGKVTFEEITEGAEYKQSLLLTNDNAKIKLKTYGRLIKITRQAIINDDLSVFEKLPKLLAQGAANFQADKVWGLVINNSKTPDGQSIFHANHSNLATGAAKGTINENTLSAVRVSMYRQKTPAGEFMSISPKWLIVPAELLMIAEKMLTGILANATGDVNVFANKFQIMTNPRLIDPNTWYMAADSKTTEGLVYAYLEGEQGLYIDKEVNFSDDSVSTKARIDFDAAAWDYRSWYKNPGI